MEEVCDVLTGGVLGAVGLGLYSLYAKHQTVSRLKAAMITAAERGKAPLPPLPTASQVPAAHPASAGSSGWMEASNDVALAVQQSIEAAIQSEPESMRESLRHAFRAPGKMVRSRLVGLLCKAANSEVAKPKMIDLCSLVELEHTASLLHDDVVDEAATRRGEKSHCARFGGRQSVLHGDYLVALVVDRLSKIGDPEVTKGVAQSMLELVRGELLQIGNFQDQPFTRYMEKSFCKTAALFVAAVEAFARLGNKNIFIFRRVGVCVGLAFQLVDDCLDFEEADLGKPGLGSDLAHGHFTAPVLLADPHVRRAIRAASVQDALGLVRQGQGLQRTRRLAAALVEEAKSLLKNELKPSENRDALFGLLEALVCRKN